MKRPRKAFNRKLMISMLVILSIGSACLCNQFPVTTPSAPSPVPSTPTSFTLQIPTPEVVQGLTSAGPWLLVKTSTGLWAGNVDGSGLTLLTQGMNWSSYPAVAVQPFGNQVVVLTSSDGGYPGLSNYQLALNLLSLPDGSLRKITDLTTPQTEPGASDTAGDTSVEAIRAIREQDSYAWSPDGSKLAFIGVLDGPSAEVYIYDTRTDQITRVSQDDAQDFDPSWSPDGSHLLYFGAEVFGTGAGMSMSGAWAANGDGTDATLLYRPTSAGERLVGWRDNQTAVLESWDPGNGTTHLRLYDILTKQETILLQGIVAGAAVGAGNADDQGVVMFGKDDGLYILPPGSDQPQKVSDYPPTDTGTQIYNLRWVSYPEGRMFIVTFGDGSQTTYWPDVANGTIWSTPRRQDAPFPGSGEVVMYGVIWGWTSTGSEEPGVWVTGPGMEDKKVFDGPASTPIWDLDNNLLFFSGSDLYRVTFANRHYDPTRMGTVTGDLLDVTWAGTR